MPSAIPLLRVKNISQSLASHPSFAKFLALGKLTGITGAAQVIVQASSFVGGILVIRLLPTKEYALYTLANTMLGTMIILTDGGITSGVMAQAGQVWRDRDRVGTVLATGFALRRQSAVGSLVVAIPILLYLLRHHGASWPVAALLVGALIPAFLMALSGHLLAIPLQLHQDILPMQKMDITVNLGRLGLLCLTLFAFPWAFVAVLAAGLPQIWANWRLRTFSLAYANWRQPPDPEVRREVLGVVRRLLPDAIYYCLSGQITVWLISLAGSTAAVAQVGALARLAMGLNLFGMLFATLVVPRFARMPSDSPFLFRRYVQVQIGLVALGVGIVGGTWLFAEQLLWVLGKNYAHLETELVFNMAAGCMGLLYGGSFGMCASRGWAINPLIFIPISVASTAAGAFLFDVGTLKGIIFLSLFVNTIQVLMLMVFSVIKMRQARKAPRTAVA